MNDRQLLELAAKAAVIEWIASLDEGLTVGESIMECRLWNPLADDGDALRLAVKLKMQILAFRDWCSAGSYVQCGEREDYGNDPYAATRRAIVRAAAEIGKGMG